VEGSPRPIRVLAVNRNRILREGLSVLIGMEPGLELVATTAAPDLALTIFAEERPDLTLMDLDLPDDTGVEAILRIRQIDPAAWVIALVTDDSGENGSRAVAAGAEAVVPKDLIGELLVPMILGRHTGTRAVSI
jgi:DNA-binding NarL/FixJ family response regulator